MMSTLFRGLVAGLAIGFAALPAAAQTDYPRRPITLIVPFAAGGPTDVVIAALFGIVGYWLGKHDFEAAPMLLAYVLGPLMEENLRRAMLIARGDWTVFFTRPISGVLLGIAIFLLIVAAMPKIRKRRDEVFVE